MSLFNRTKEYEYQDCPPEVAEIMHAMLTATLLKIRNCTELDVAQKLANHAHNMPDMIERFNPQRLKYYLEVERRIFVEQTEGKHADIFLDHWEKLEKISRKLN